MPIYLQDMTISGVLALAVLLVGTLLFAQKSEQKLRWYYAVPLLIALPVIATLPISFVVETIDSHGQSPEQGGWWIVSALTWSQWLIPTGLLTYVAAIVIRKRRSRRGANRAL